MLKNYREGFSDESSRQVDNFSPTNLNIRNIYFIMVIKTMYGVEKKKVDEQGRKEVFVIKGKGYLKIVPKKKVDLTKFFDSADLGMNIEDWDKFERRFYIRC